MKLASVWEYLRGRSGLLGLLCRSTLEGWKATGYWFGFNVLGGLMPIWATPWMIKAHGQSLTYADLVKHGEFALYSAAFLAPSILVIMRHTRRHPYFLGPGIGLVALAGLLLSAFIYATVASSPNDPTLNVHFVVESSSVLFLISLVLSLLVAFVENQPVDLREVEQRDQDQLRERFETKLEQQNG